MIISMVVVAILASIFMVGPWSPLRHILNGEAERLGMLSMAKFTSITVPICVIVLELCLYFFWIT